MARRKKTANGGVIETLSNTDIDNFWRDTNREARARGAEPITPKHRAQYSSGSTGKNGG